MSRRERITAAASFAGCCVLVMSAGLPLWLRAAPVPVAAPPAVSGSASPSRGTGGASVMPVAASRMPSPGPSYGAPVLAAYGQGASLASPVLPPASPAPSRPGPAQRKHPGPAQGSTPAPQPQATGGPPPAVAVTLATSPPPCTASLNVLGLGGCLNLGG